MRGLNAIVIALCGFVLAGCASTRESIAANDPLEPMNCAVFSFDEKFDRYVEFPVAGAYLLWIPAPARNGLENFFSNLDVPIDFANDLLQGDVTHAGQAFVRFGVNSTVGLGGFWDVASKTGLPYRPQDFGETLSFYGVGEGPFLVLPIVGPDPPRDLVGDAFDVAIDPLTYMPPHVTLLEHIGTTVGLHVASPFATNARNVILRQELERTSLDPYVTMRSVYRQIRANQISGGPPSEDLQPSR